MRPWILVGIALVVLAAIVGWFFQKQVERERLWRELSANSFSNISECLAESGPGRQGLAFDHTRCIEIELEVDKAIGY